MARHGKSTTDTQHLFSKIPSAQIPRSQFNRSHGIKTTFDAGYLIPILVDEVLPGDTFNCRLTTFARLATPIVPIMDNMYLDTHFFAVPMRLVWENWHKFNGAQDDPGDSTSFTIPKLNSSTIADGSLSDHLGMPTGAHAIENMSCLFHRSYNLIWNEFFRDENLQDSETAKTDDGPDGVVLYGLLRRGKRHDYFTSCLPWPQKGDAIELPLGTVAPVVSTGTGIPKFDINDSGAEIQQFNKAAANNNATFSTAGTETGPAHWETTELEADLSSATAATINELRQAFQLQKLAERDARGGTRLTEVIRAHFGVISPDARLQRPEYLGGGSQPMNITQVPQTSQTDTTPLGEVGGYGIATGQQHGFTKSFTEHCIILGLASVRGDLNYQEGIPKMFSRQTRFDFYWPALAQIGEQPVLNKEIFADGSAADELTFGYQERYAEYRYKQGTITGLFRSQATGSLDLWHIAEEFGALPVLNASFIESDPPIDRVIAVPAEPHIKFDGWFDYICARPMPVYGVPGRIDHF